MANKLEGKFEEIVELIIDGKTFRQIAQNYGVALSTLHDFISKDEHSARARMALDFSSNEYAEKAEQVLLQAKGGSMAEMQRARELAQHYRWLASKRSPKRYGDKIELSGDKENPLVVQQITGIKVE